MTTDPTARTTWRVAVQEQDGELILPLPPELLDQLGWQIGDDLVWASNDQDQWILSKKE